MTNNNWEKEWREKYDIGSWVAPNGQRYPYSEIYGFINSLLTKKDQEHKAELEMIKGEIGEIVKRNTIIMPNGKFPVVVYPKDVDDHIKWQLYEMGVNATKQILDSHINKLSTE